MGFLDLTSSTRPRLRRYLARIWHIAPRGSAFLFGWPSSLFPPQSVVATRLQTDVVVYDVPSLEEINRFAGLEPRFSPDGSRLAVLNFDDGVTIWNTTTWETVLQTADHLTNPFHMNWSDDGTRLVIGGGQSEVQILDAGSLNLIQTVPFQGATAVGVAFVNGDRHVVVGTRDGKVLVLTLDTEELVSIAGERLTRGLSDDECQLYGIDPCVSLEELLASGSQDASG